MLPVLETPPFLLVWLGLCAYIVGSLPLGRLAANQVRFCCISNATRERSAALTKVLVDQSKGFLLVYYVGVYAAQDAAQLAVLLVYLGHLFPVGRPFDRNNGTGTLLGALTGLDPQIGLVALVAWLVAFFVYRYATLAVVLSTAVTPFAMLSLGETDYAGLLIVLAFIVMKRHASKLHQLLLGKEQAVDWREIAQRRAMAKSMADKFRQKEAP